MNTTGAKVERKLTTIVAADAAGYSSAMDADELGTVEALRAAREVFSKFITRHNGRIASTAGDGLIADFPSVVEAVQCAIEVQRELGDAGHPANGALRFRIGIHLGDVLVDGDDLLGEGVNLAARLQTMAEPGGVLVSQQVYDQVRNKLSVGFEYLGEKRPKNFSEDVPVYCVSFGDEAPKSIFGRHGSHQPKRQEHKHQTEEPSAPKRAARDGVSEEPATTDDGVLRETIIRQAKMLGVIWVALAVINLVTSGPMWVQWPGIAILAMLAWRAAPLYATGGFKIQYVRFAVIVGALVLINLFSWSGTLWVIWPAGALLVAEVIRRLRVSA
jgi:adenylate cyclase